MYYFIIQQFSGECICLNDLNILKFKRMSEINFMHFLFIMGNGDKMGKIGEEHGIKCNF